MSLLVGVSGVLLVYIEVSNIYSLLVLHERVFINPIISLVSLGLSYMFIQSPILVFRDLSKRARSQTVISLVIISIVLTPIVAFLVVDLLS